MFRYYLSVMFHVMYFMCRTKTYAELATLQAGTFIQLRCEQFSGFNCL